MTDWPEESDVTYLVGRCFIIRFICFDAVAIFVRHADRTHETNTKNKWNKNTMHEHITIKKTGVCVAVDTGPALQRRARYAKHTSDSGPEKNGRDNNRLIFSIYSFGIIYVYFVHVLDTIWYYFVGWPAMLGLVCIAFVCCRAKNKKISSIEMLRMRFPQNAPHQSNNRGLIFNLLFFNHRFFSLLFVVFLSSSDLSSFYFVLFRFGLTAVLLVACIGGCFGQLLWTSQFARIAFNSGLIAWPGLWSCISATNHWANEKIGCAWIQQNPKSL